MKQLKILLTFFIFITNGVVAMELLQLSPKSSPRKDLAQSDGIVAKAIHDHQAFDFSRKDKDASSMIMIISPVKGDKSVLLAKKGGTVSQYLFDNNEEKRLIKHDRVKHIPMIAATEKDGSLLLVSAGNYTSTEKITKAECWIWHKRCFRTIDIKPVQAIAINKEGSLLAIADQLQNISIVSLDTDKEIARHWFYSSLDKSDRLIDVAFDPSGRMIILAKAKGMQLMGLNNNRLETIKRFDDVADVKAVYFPLPGKVMYLTSDRQVKMLSLFEFSSELEKPIVLFDKLLHDRVTIDEESGDTVALWTKNQKASYALRHQIVVRKKHLNTTEELLVEVPEFCIQNNFNHDEKYEYRSNKGSINEGIHHLKQVALRGNNLVLLGSDGKLHWRKIGEDDKNEDVKKVTKELDMLDSALAVLRSDEDEEKVSKLKKKNSALGIRGRSKSEEAKNKTVYDILFTKKSEEQEKNISPRKLPKIAGESKSRLLSSDGLLKKSVHMADKKTEHEQKK